MYALIKISERWHAKGLPKVLTFRLSSDSYYYKCVYIVLTGEDERIPRAMIVYASISFSS